MISQKIIVKKRINKRTLFSIISQKNFVHITHILKEGKKGKSATRGKTPHAKDAAPNYQNKL